MQIAENDGYFCLCNQFGGKVVFMPPYLYDEEKFVDAITEMVETAKSFGKKFRIRGLTAEQVKLLPKNLTITTNRDDYDYIYSAKDLKYLKGKAFHSKRNFLARFQKSYSYSVEEYSEEKFDEVIKLVDDWAFTSSHETMNYEKEAIIRALRFNKELNFKILTILVEGKIVAFSVSHIASNGVAHTLFEKADTTFVGAYPTINYFTANKFFDDDFFVNRQEDMGIEGLRKAKLSYSPIMLLEKYSIEG